MSDTSMLEVMARMTDTKINIKEVCDKWLMITYDLPHTEEGDRARREFLMAAHSIGAAKHTESVYLLPWTPEAEVLALELSRVKNGEVFIWTSQATDQSKIKEITQTYDEGLAPIMDEISERIDRIEEHQARERYGRAEKMLPKTEKMLDDMQDAILRRGSAVLFIHLQLMQRRFAGLRQIYMLYPQLVLYL